MGRVGGGTATIVHGKCMHRMLTRPIILQLFGMIASYAILLLQSSEKYEKQTTNDTLH
jgi:hypothetical protein